MTERRKVLIVDDEPVNRALLEAIVSTMEVDATLVENGRQAVAAFERDRFDLVLLDVMMPVLDGLATLPLLRTRTAPGEHVPIVLVTALDARADRIRGLEAGADDFLTKPVDPHEVRCRVRTLLQLRVAQLALKRRAEELEAVQRAKSELAAMIVHDLKNPLAAIVANVRWLTGRFQADTAPDGVGDALADVSQSTDRLLGLVATLTDVEKAEAGGLTVERANNELVALLDPIAHQHRREARDRNVTLGVSAQRGVVASLDRVLVTRAIENLLLNALRYAGSGGRVLLSARDCGDHVELAVSNTGQGIAEELGPQLFQKYATTERRARENLGLGLYFCRLVAEAHGGRIFAERAAEWSTRFTLQLPRG